MDRKTTPGTRRSDGTRIHLVGVVEHCGNLLDHRETDVKHNETDRTCPTRWQNRPMRIVVDLHGARHEVDLRQHASTATLADLVESVTGTRPAQDSQLWVDDRAHPGSRRLADLTILEGTQVASAKRDRPLPLHGWSVTVSGGIDTGRTFPVTAGRPLLVGRSRSADIFIDSPTASRRHAELAVTDAGLRVRDLGSANGTSVDGRTLSGTASPQDSTGSADHVAGTGSKTAFGDDARPRPRGRTRLPWGRGRTSPESSDEDVAVVGDGAVLVIGDTALTVRFNAVEPLAPVPGSLHNLTPAATAPFNRPPRPRHRQVAQPIEPPTRKAPPPPARFNVVTIGAPLLMAGGMVALTRSVQYAGIALLSPVAAAWGHVDQKRRRRRELAEEEARFETALKDLDAEIEKTGTRRRERLREEIPDPVVTLRTAGLPTTRLWQRRPLDDDHLRLHAGVGDLPWTPELDSRHSGRLDEEVQRILDRATLPQAPVPVELSEAGVVGIIGNRDAGLALARSLVCQAAVHCGPADLTIAVFCDPGREQSWAWSTWLPQVRLRVAGSESQWLSAQRGYSDALLRTLRDDVERGQACPLVLLVVDSDVLTEGRDAPARALLGHGRDHRTAPPHIAPMSRVSGIVLAATEHALPASANCVITVDASGRGTLNRLDGTPALDDVLVAGLSVETARGCAMDLARFEDPELVVPGSSLPDLVRLPTLLGLDEISPEAIRRSWSATSRIAAPIGVGSAGVLTLDLVRDGPHGLVGGTTGSGKSEFLRSLVAGLAARTDPTRLTFILIDFKGGAAFAACDRLPHTIGTVSNLDAQLADRALRALEAELRYRQEVFAAAGEGIDNLDAYLATRPARPMPRLLVVIDEFAMLAKDYPDVLSSLVRVAAVGRTLGVHLILATQRPAGVVNDDILANTNLRVALRVQSREDSSNVIGVPAASAIGRTQMGRAYIKLGQDDLTAVQTALVTGRSTSGHAGLVDVQPVGFGPTPPPTPTPTHETTATTSPTPTPDDPTDLDLLIDAIVEANTQLGFPPPRPVWPEPLGDRVDLAATSGPDPAGPVIGAVTGPLVELGLSDDPDRQRQLPATWNTHDGNLLLLGIPGSGTTTTLATLALTLAAAQAPHDLDLMVLDLGSRDLAPLADLPHTTAYVPAGAAAAEQRVRFLKYLRDELDRRRATGGPHRELVVLIDGLATLKDEYGDDTDGLRLLAGLYAAYTDGPDVGMRFALASTRAKAVPGQIDEVTTQKWLFRLADPYDYASAGLAPALAPAPVPGRCVPAQTKLQTHIASTSLPLPDAVAHLSARWGHPAGKPTVIGQLPDRVTPAELDAVADVTTEPWRIPVGIRESDLKPAWIAVYEGEHLLVAGPARSGKSSVLLALAEVLRRGAAAAGKDIAIWGICGRRSPLATADGLDRVAIETDGLAPLLASARVHRGPLVLLCDDAEKFDDSDKAIEGLLTAHATDLLVIAAGRADDLRTMYGHWTKLIRKSRAGILLQPNIDYDGELFGRALPRRSPVPLTTARGYVCADGTYDLAQLASS
jgi:S-DNA-T family DNA segregation ATPase FtsK/SpoIIIE